MVNVVDLTSQINIHQSTIINQLLLPAVPRQLSSPRFSLDTELAVSVARRLRKPKFGGPIRTALRNQRSTDV